MTVGTLTRETNPPGSQKRNTGVLRKIWKVLTYTPVKDKPWHWHAFHSLYCLTAVVACMLSLSSWLGQTTSFPVSSLDPCDSPESGCYKEPDWNAPLDMGNGKCFNITTREITECTYE